MPNKIRNFGMTRMALGSCADFHDKVHGFITEATPEALHIEAYSPSYTKAVQQLALIVNRQPAFISTKALKDADYIRDRACGTINSVINAYRTSPVEEKREAAELLSPQLSPYKAIRHHKYSKQTAEVKGMYAVLTAEKNKAAVTLLGLDPETAMLLKANQNFEKIFLEKAAEASEKAKIRSLNSDTLIKEANGLFESIVDVVNAYAIVQTSDEIENFIEKLNGIIEVYASEAGSSTSSSDTDADKTPTEGEEGGEDEIEPDQPTVDDGEEGDDRPVVQ